MTLGKSAIEILADGSALAAVYILQSRGIDPKSLNPEEFSASLREVMKDELDAVLQEWKDAVEARMGNDFLKYQMNVQCNHIGMLALQKLGLI